MAGRGVLCNAHLRSKKRRHQPGSLLLAIAVSAAAVTAAVSVAFVPCHRPRPQPGAADPARHPRVAARLRGDAATRATASVTAAEISEEAPPSILEELLELAAPASGDGGQEALAARVDADFGSISPEDLSELQMMIATGGSEGERAQAVAVGIQTALDNRMTGAKEAIEDLIANAAGDVNVAIRKCLKKQESPLPLLIVLQLNIEQAKTDEDEEKLRALLHINTVINEELEKKVSRVRGLLNKLLRMDDAGIRDNLLRHHLTPVQVASGPDDPFGEGEGAEPQLMAALVPPGRFASAISQLVNDIDRQLKVAVGDEDTSRYEMTERIRLIAKEARLIIGEIYGEAEMNAFGADLTPAFTALMSYKMREAPPQPAEEQAAGLPPPEPLPPQASAQA